MNRYQKYCSRVARDSVRKQYDTCMNDVFEIFIQEEAFKHYYKFELQSNKNMDINTLRDYYRKSKEK